MIREKWYEVLGVNKVYELGMSLQVVVISATNVPNPETLGKCDPYAVIEFQGKFSPCTPSDGES